MPNKYRREIEEILEEAGELAPTPRLPRSSGSFLKIFNLYISRFLGGKGWANTAGRMMLTAVVLLLGALVFKVAFLAWIGLLLFIVSYGMLLIKNGGSQTEKRWRGQPINTESRSWWDRFRRS